MLDIRTVDICFAEEQKNIEYWVASGYISTPREVEVVQDILYRIHRSLLIHLTKKNMKQVFDFKIAAGTTVYIGGIPVTLQEDAVVSSATDFLELSRNHLAQYEFTRPPGNDEQGLIMMKEHVASARGDG